MSHRSLVLYNFALKHRGPGTKIHYAKYSGYACTCALLMMPEKSILC